MNFKSYSLLAGITILWLAQGEKSRAGIFGTSPEEVLDLGISCVADIVYQQSGGRDGIELAVSTLSGVLAAMPGTGNMLKTVEKCRIAKESLLPASRVSPEIYGSMLKMASQGAYPGVLHLLSGFSEPKMFCSKNGISLGASILLGPGIGAGFSLCHDSFGSRWLAFDLNGQVQLKWSGISAYTYHDPRSVEAYSPYPVYRNKERHREFSNSLLSTDRAMYILKMTAFSAILAGTHPLGLVKGLQQYMNLNPKALLTQDWYKVTGSYGTYLAAGGILSALLNFRSTDIRKPDDRLIGQGYALSLGGMSRNFGEGLSIVLLPWYKNKKYLRDILLDVNQETVEVRISQ